MPIGADTASILLFAFVFNICISGLVFWHYARAHGWKRPGFGESKPESHDEDHDQFAVFEPEQGEEHHAEPEH